MSQETKPEVNGKHDLWSHRIVVGSLEITASMTGAAVTALAVQGSDAPPSLLALGVCSLAFWRRL